MVHVGDYLYALGGHDGYDMKSSAERTRVLPDGSLSAWESISSMTSRRDGLVGRLVLVIRSFAFGGSPDNATGQTALLNGYKLLKTAQ